MKFYFLLKICQYLKICFFFLIYSFLYELQQHGCGDRQWGFRRRCSSSDLVLVCISRWVLAACCGFKIGAYLSDITGAFDRVCKDFLLAKLHSLGVSDCFLDFLNSYLEPRIGHVAVDGVLSEVMLLSDMCFQGTVLGPALWNSFFHDVAMPAESNGETAAMFADDLNIFKKFDVGVPNSTVMDN